MKYERKTEKEDFIKVNGENVYTMNDILKGNPTYRECVLAFSTLDDGEDYDIKATALWAANSVSLLIERLEEDKDISRYVLLYNTLLFIRFVYQRNAKGEETFDKPNIPLIAELDIALSKEVEKMFKKHNSKNYKELLEELLEEESSRGIAVVLTDAIVRVVSSNKDVVKFC
nr:MAG TPA: hypothetical protein [Caudoviricetes sp.]